MNLHATFVIWIIFTGVYSMAAAVSGGFPTTLPLHRAIPLKDRVEVSQLIAHDQARHGRRLQSINGVVDFPLAGTYKTHIGLYYTKVRLGTPAQEFIVQIDTGSDALWVSCNGCTGCPQTSGLQDIQPNFFNPSSSLSATKIHCTDKQCEKGAQYNDPLCDNSNNCAYQIRYADVSGTEGYYVSDLLHLETVAGNSRSFNISAKVIFGCSLYQFGDLAMTTAAVNGIFGLGQQAISVVTQLSSQGITPAAFSHCLRGDGNGGGVMVLGSIVEPGIVYSPIVPSMPHYCLNLQSIAVNGQRLAIDSSVFSTSSSAGTIIDSGTTLAYLPEEAYNSFVSAISGAVSQSVRSLLYRGNTCYLTASSVDDLFPKVSLNFAGGASMVLKPQDYLLEQYSIAGAVVWCIGFQKTDGQGMTVLGDLILKDKIVVYDLANQQIGWVNYDCSLSVNVSIRTGSNSNRYVNAGQLSNNISSMSPSMIRLIAVLVMLASLMSI